MNCKALMIMIERNEEFKEKQGLSSVVAHILVLAFSFDAFTTLTSIKEMFNFLVGLRRCNVFYPNSSFKKERNYPAAPHLLRHRPAHVQISTLRRPLAYRALLDSYSAWVIALFRH
jgi:hypothetical protein